MVKMRSLGNVGSGCLAALAALLFGIASCDRGAGNLTMKSFGGDAGASAGASAACEDDGNCEGGLSPPPHFVDNVSYEFEAGPHQFKEPPNTTDGPAEARCPPGEVVVGVVVALKQDDAPVFNLNYLGPYKYPVYFAPRCAVLNPDDSLGAAHTLDPLFSADQEHAEAPVTYDCPRGMVGVAVRGTLDREEDMETGEVWVSSLGLECANPRAWFYGEDWSRSVIVVGADGKTPFVNGCTRAVGLLNGIGARARDRFLSLTNWCVHVAR
jgi:hypothetical protein